MASGLAAPAFAGLLLLAATAAAEAQPSVAARADAGQGSAEPASALPVVPKLVLSLPPLPPEALRRAESSLGPAYWNAMQHLRSFRDAGDAELRLRIETASFVWGGFTLSAGITSIPERERECAPSCVGPEWSSSVLLRYPLDDVGPLRQVGPELEVGGKLGAERGSAPRLFKAGVGGAF